MVRWPTGVQWRCCMSWAGMNDVAAASACVESSAGRSALSIWTCDLEGPAGARVGVSQTRRSLAAGELLLVVGGELGGEAARVRSVAFGRLPARAGAGAVGSLAAISKKVDAVDLFWWRARTARTGRRGTNGVTRCPLLPQGTVPAVER
jgi:hypothetical protein